MKILLLTRYDRQGASSRVRTFQYLPYLRSHGLEITVSPLMGDDYLHRLYAGRGKSARSICMAYIRRLSQIIRASEYDLLWVEKEFFPFLPSWTATWLRTLGVPYVVDYDDAVFHAYDMYGNRFVRWFLRDKIDRVMEKSALVIAGNDYLAERARRAGTRRIALLPSVVDTERYRIDPVEKGETFVIGWVGSPSTSRYLKQVESALAEVCGRCNARLVLVGSGEIVLQGVPTEIRPWSEENEVADIGSFDVGIMPLDDSPWERGKCGYKLIQCMAAGRPVIASPVGINRQIVDHGVNGFLATTREEWTDALTTLCRDRELRRSMGAAARQKVEAEYCLKVNAPRLLELLRSAAGGRS